MNHSRTDALYRARLRRTVTAAALTLGLLCSTALAGALDDARKARDAGDWERALELYEQAVSESPEDVAALVGLSETLRGLGRFEEAAKVGTNDLAEANPDLALARAHAFMLLADQVAASGGDTNLIYGYAADSERWTKVVLKADPESAEGLWLKAKRIQHQGNQEEALQILREARELHPDDFQLAWEIGQHWFRVGTRENDNAEAWKQAWIAFKAASEADTESADALLNSLLARQWYLAKAPDEARGAGADKGFPEDYEKVALLKPGDDVPLKNLWKVQGDKELRVAAYGRIREANSEDPNAWLYHAYALKDAGNVNKAIVVFQEALDKWPGHSALLKNLADTLWTAKRHDDAIAVYENLVKSWDGSYYERAYGSVQALATKGGISVEQRERIWTALWQGVPSVAWAANNAGLWFRDVGKDYEKALLWYERAAEQAPEDIQILNDTGLIHHFHFWDRKGSQKKAVDYYLRAVKAAIDQGENTPRNSGPGMGYRDAVNNLFQVWSRQEAWKTMKEFAETYLDGDPRQSHWLETAKNKG